MKFCPKCEVQIKGIASRCPLCQGDLLKPNSTIPEDDSIEVFPLLSSLPQKHHFVLKLLSFISFAIVFISALINFLTSSTSWWSIYVAGGILCLWIIFSIAFAERKNIFKNILWQNILISILALVWDLFTGFHGWSINYFIPILCTLTLINMLIFRKTLQVQIGDYILYILLDALFGVFLIILVLLGVLDCLIPVSICVGLSIFTLLYLLIFEGSHIFSELKRRLHL